MGKECDFTGCPKRAHYGVDGTKRAEFCAQHAQDGFVNVLAPRCKHQGCAKRPTFGVPGEKVGTAEMAEHADGWLLVGWRLLVSLSPPCLSRSPGAASRCV